MTGKFLHYLFSSSRTELAVLASSPVVGSSRKRTEGSMISSIPMFVLFLSPPEIPRVICVPTWENANQTRVSQCKKNIKLFWLALGVIIDDVWLFTLESATLVRPSSLMRWLTRASFSLWGTELGSRSAAEKRRFSLTVRVPMTTSS